MRVYLFLTSAAILLLDQVTKHMVASQLALHDTVEVIPGFFRITHVLNTGAAFGIMADTPGSWKLWVLIGFSVVALTVIVRLIWNHGRSFTLPGLALAMIMGGALGNLYDRLVLGHVVDFLEFHVRNYYWPAFNVADSAIVAGAGLLIFDMMTSRTPQNNPPEPDPA